MSICLKKGRQGKKKEECLFFPDNFNFLQRHGGWNRPLGWLHSFGQSDLIGRFQQQNPVILMSVNELLNC